MANTREEFGEEEGYTEERELEYREYLAGLAAGKIQPFDFEDQAAVQDTEMSDRQFEAYIAHCCQNMYQSELAPYTHLGELQGSGIPRLYGTASYRYQLPEGTDCHIGIQGLVLEYISSVSLREFIRGANNSTPPPSPSIIRNVCNEAVTLINRVSECGVLNTDVRLDNVLVRSRDEIKSSELHCCVLIDFAQCRLRGKDETEEDWISAKVSQDEEGAICYIVEGDVRKFIGNGVWKYVPSRKFAIVEDVT